MGQLCWGQAKPRSDILPSSDHSDDGKVEDKKIKLLFLGAGESGKTTLYKQLKINFAKDFDDNNLSSIKTSVINGFSFSFLDFLKAIEADHGTKTGGENVELLDKIEKYFPNDLSKLTKSLNNSEIIDVVKQVWESDYGRETWAGRANFGIADSLGYFCENLDRISAVDYEPTEQDYLLTRIKTTGVQEQTFRYKGVDLFVIDVGGQENERRKWFQVFDGVTAILYVVSLNAFDKVLHEDRSKERLPDSIQLFAKTANAAVFKDVPFILFLNKEDLLKEKVRALTDSETDLDEVFPGIGLGKNYNDCTAKIKEYLKEKFLDALKVEKRPAVYPHFVTATDKDTFLRVFSAATQIVLSSAIEGHFEE